MTDRSAFPPRQPDLFPSAKLDVPALLKVAHEAYWKMVHDWTAHRFYTPQSVFDMACFAPEVREFMDEVERRLYDALIQYSVSR